MIGLGLDPVEVKPLGVLKSALLGNLNKPNAYPVDGTVKKVEGGMTHE